MRAIRLKVLVADDSATVHDIFANMAKHSSIPFDIIKASDGLQCMELLNQGRADVAFIDVNMPEMDGIEALGKARLSGVKTFVTLMSSADADPRRRTLARLFKVYELLTKPFTLADVEAILKTYRRVTAPMRALIVDDSTTVRRLIAKVMNGSIFNINCTEAGDGEKALSLCEAGGFDVVMLDCNMPGIDGTQTLERLLELDPGIKVVMMSAERNPERTRWSLDRGAFAFLQKPFYPRDIDRILHEIFGLRIPELAADEH